MCHYIKGVGVGPMAVFSYDVLDVGDTFVNAVHQYEVELMNRGEIEAEFRLVPPTSAFGRSQYIIFCHVVEHAFDSHNDSCLVS